MKVNIRYNKQKFKNEPKPISFGPGCMGEQQAKLETSPGCMGEQQVKLATSPGCMGEQQAKLATSPGCMGEQQAKLATSPPRMRLFYHVKQADKRLTLMI